MIHNITLTTTFPSRRVPFGKGNLPARAGIRVCAATNPWIIRVRWVCMKDMAGISWIQWAFIKQKTLQVRRRENLGMIKYIP